MNNIPPEKFDVIVIGAGHAGCEAALAAARLGASCCLITFNLKHIGLLSCNPAIGGLAKGHLVREIDALGGEMGRNADATGIQFRLLNRGKGPAVWSSRAQVDIDLYPQRLQQVCQNQSGLWLIESEVKQLLVKNNQAIGIKTILGQKIIAKAIVITTGTFLHGVIHIGLSNYFGGRIGDSSNITLSKQLKKLGFKLYRLKTGTCPRLDRRSLDLDKLPIQSSDSYPRMFSFLNKFPKLTQVNCWIIHTNKLSHKIIRDNLHQAPMYAGTIAGIGARYCPSIEDKIVRFPERESHQIFLEPQGLNNHLIYPNGISTSLPLNIQISLIRSLPGCEKALIVRPGYAIEYDMSDPLDLTLSLESKKLSGVFLAGQINGTSGYEEAAAQGLIAGINAARFSQKLDPIVIDRSQAYIGVLIDDLVTKGVTEPYRMFTSRAEYRLTLREDNADLRLTPLGRKIGLVKDEQWSIFITKQKAVKRLQILLNSTRINPTLTNNKYLTTLNSAPLQNSQTAAELLRRPELNFKNLIKLNPTLDSLLNIPSDVAEQTIILLRYSGYEKRERKQIEQFRNRKKIDIPPNIDYQVLPGLSQEIKEKLIHIRPTNLGQAERISGITPSAINIIYLYLIKLTRQNLIRTHC